jgi:hypothetical protein
VRRVPLGLGGVPGRTRGERGPGHGRRLIGGVVATADD